MPSKYDEPDPQTVIDGVSLDLRRRGTGTPMLFLQGIESWIRIEDFSERLSEHYDLLMPQHPGFGHSDLPDDFRDVGDVAQFYLHMLDVMDLSDVVLVGTSFGGWVAAEMASRCCSRISALIVANPFGVRFSDNPNDREIQDIYAMSQEEITRHFYYDADSNRRDVTELPEHTLVSIARSRETMCLFSWKPYMHNPSLKRWLKHISVPTLVLWGEADQVMTVDHGKAFADLIPGAEFSVIPMAGHYPHLERPQEFTSKIIAFLKANNCA